MMVSWKISGVFVLLLELVGGDWSISVVQNLETRGVAVVLDFRGISVIVLVNWFSCCFTAVLLLPLLLMKSIPCFQVLPHEDLVEAYGER